MAKRTAEDITIVDTGYFDKEAYDSGDTTRKYGFAVNISANINLSITKVTGKLQSNIDKQTTQKFVTTPTDGLMESSSTQLISTNHTTYTMTGLAAAGYLQTLMRLCRTSGIKKVTGGWFDLVASGAWGRFTNLQFNDSMRTDATFYTFSIDFIAEEDIDRIV